MEQEYSLWEVWLGIQVNSSITRNREEGYSYVYAHVHAYIVTQFPLS